MPAKATFPAVPAPVAEKHPVSDTRHGITRTDDYAWMRADNWQEVFRDPAILDATIRRHLEAENAYQAKMMADTEALRKTLFAEMKGRIKEDDFDRSREGRAVRLWHVVQKGRRASPLLPHAARRRQGGDLPRRGSRGRWQSLFPHRRGRSFTRPRAAAVGLRRQGIGVLHAQGPRHGDPRRSR